MMGFTLALKALLATVLQSTEPPPPPPLLLQEMPVKTNKIITDVIVKAFLMFNIFREELILSDVK